ncbi:tetratricopeptide repeat protein [Leptospira sp. GIMC2001]|uniref:tetratricopeptide repeat protein n=1 Tax=Leptospira sp. GIMC2001 TaxID=1513297 RepID=UPI00234A5778|nr:tetratricopeptide repeat protein [Leptospira sp. GIMC2001]WCL49670.1 tetratricopeptide repeat protein [Leptospira sp. GIMC2001]
MRFYFSLGFQIRTVIVFLGIVGTLLYSNSIIAEEFPDLYKSYSEGSNFQGDLVLRKAQNYYQDKFYEQCIQELKTFSLVYPNHPKKAAALRLLGEVHEKKRDYNLAIDAQMAIYLDNPSSKEGFIAFLSAGRSYLKMGEVAHARKVFQEILDDSFFPDINKEAEMELKQIKILSQEIGQNQDF